MQVLSSLSGITFYAPSAGFSPTNSADVSAIASSYQVVSATATQLYAGTAYVTSVNDTQLSAARAGNAANASLANSAWYDGTGRLISALPDSAAVSAIASAYAESAASGKQDELTFGYDDGKISSIDGSALVGQGGGGVDSATVSAIASSYAESAASSKVDLYNVNDINITAKGLAISGASGITARYGNNMAVLQTYPLHRMYLYDQGTNKGVYTYPSGISGNGDGNWQYGTAEYGKLTSVYDTVSGNSATWGAAGVDSSTCSAIASAYAESAASSKLDTTAFNSGDFYTTANPSGFVDSAYVDSTVSGKADASALSGYYTTANESGFITGVDLTDYATTAYVDSAVSSKADSSALSSYVPYSSLEYNTASAISGINGSALAAGSTYSAGEGIDITDDVISVEAPVDIVAGPGIVIDNPDGNTLRVSQATNYEVELYYSPQNQNVATNAEFAMSESIWNFSKVLITFDNMEFGNRTCTMLIDLEVSDTETKFYTPYCNGDTPGTVNIAWAAFKINAAGNIQYSNRGLIYGTWTAPQFTTGTSRGYRVKRVVGIHRIANN